MSWDSHVVFKLLGAAQKQLCCMGLPGTLVGDCVLRVYAPVPVRNVAKLQCACCMPGRVLKLLHVIPSPFLYDLRRLQCNATILCAPARQGVEAFRI